MGRAEEGWGYLEANDPCVTTPEISHYFIPAPMDDWDEGESGCLPLCGQFLNWDDYGVVIEPNEHPQCKKCLKALERRGHEQG